MKAELMRLLLLLRPTALLFVGLTLVAYVFVLLRIRRLRPQGRAAQLAGLFVGLDGHSALHLSFAWAKFALLCAVLLSAQPARLPHYLLLTLLLVGTLMLRPSLSAMVTEVLGSGLLLAGVAVCATLLNYLRQIRSDDTIRAAYWLLAVFLILCALGVLLREVTVISRERNHFDETGDTE